MGADPLKAYFVAKDIEGHLDKYKSVEEYANKALKQSESKPEKVIPNFSENKGIAETIIHMKKFLVLCRAREKAAIDWPNSTHDKDLILLQVAQIRFGAKHPKRAKAMKEFISNERKLGFKLRFYWVAWKINGEILEKNRKLAVASDKYARVAQKALDKLTLYVTKFPKIVSPGDLFTLERQCQTYFGIAGDVAKSLGKIGKINVRTIKECDQRIKESKMWVNWAKSDTAKDDSALKKSVKAGSPKK